MQSTFGCARCCGDDAIAAFDASHAHELASVVSRPHFAVHVTRCACGQHFARVFTEQVDRQYGDDDQRWLVLPIHDDEVATLTKTAADQVESMLTALGRERRFLACSHPSGTAMRAWWRDGGLAVGPHD